MAETLDFPAAKRYLAGRARFGMKFGLETMRSLIAELRHPEQAFACISIAGTNGKGSVAAYCDSVLRATGLRVGVYTSPHLVRINERIAVSGRVIPDQALAQAVGIVRAAAERCRRKGSLRAHPTFFEVLTAAALVHFRRARVEVAVLEVGLGGRLDATNVVDPLASAIVSIDFDHQEQLGDSLAEIASEKAGVLRPGRTTVLGPLPPEARAAVARVARGTGARLLDARRGARCRVVGEGLDISTPLTLFRGLRPLPGVHQRDNLLVALRLLEASRAAGLPVDLAAVPAAIAKTHWPGRLEMVAGEPPLLLDGAHNPAGARALARHLRGGPPFVLLFGAMADKDLRGLAGALFPLARAVVLTRAPIARAARPSDIARAAGRLAAESHQEPGIGRALARARRLAREAQPGTMVVVAGSLYLVGAVKAQLERRRVASGSAIGRV